jgi:hypothetical protein
MTSKPSKFDMQAQCEETADFIPSQNDLIDSLPPEILEASYLRTPADNLFAFGRELHSSLNRIALDRSEADLRGEAYLMTV